MDSQIIAFCFSSFLPAHPQDHEPSISSIISWPICKPIFISPTSYRNSPMGPPTLHQFSQKFLPSLGHSFHTGAPVSVFCTSFPHLFIISCTNTFYYQPFILSSPLTTYFPFWPHATHVTLGWSITSHLPPPASSISSEHYLGHLPLSSEFVHHVPPLAQLIHDLVVPLTLDLVTRLRPRLLSCTLQPRAVWILPTS
jgi:hypothetical protein